jgi:diadenosine tetraphosphate (Ap4A) HIT family hydrolase
MADSVYTKVRKKEIPGYVLYEDEICFVILTIQPHNPGHVLLIPVEEVADWQEMDPKNWAHLMQVAQQFGKLIKQLYGAPKIGLAAVGFEIPHVHIHVFSMFEIADIDHDKANQATSEDLTKEADKLRAAIKAQGGIQL